MTDCTHLLQQRLKRRSKTLSSHSTTFSQSLERLVGILLFVDPGVKVDGTYYCDFFSVVIVAASHTIRQVSGEFIFQEDSAPAYRAQ